MRRFFVLGIILTIGTLFLSCATSRKESKSHLEETDSSTSQNYSSMNPFIVTLDVLSENSKLIIPIHQAENASDDVDYNLDCDGDSIYEKTHQHSDIECFYANKGEITLRVVGTIPGVQLCANESNADSFQLKFIEQWGDIAWKTMEGFAGNCDHIDIRATDTPDLRNVKSMARMFEGASTLNAPLDQWDVSHIENMSYVFYSASSFNQNISKWDVSHVKDMKGMFWSAESFNQSLEQWDVSQVTDMSYMFSYANSFNQKLSSWNVSHVTDMESMFGHNESFNQDISTWDVSSVTNMALMFGDAEKFNQDISQWNVSNVVSMYGMFSGASAFNQPLNAWDVSQVMMFDDMFSYAESFNQPLDQWDIKSAESVFGMFFGADKFIRKNKKLFKKWHNEYGINIDNLTNK